MEASIRDIFDQENEEDDLDFFSIKVHERFCGNYCNHNDDEFVSDDEFIEENDPYQTTGLEKPRSGISPETKKDTFSMLDSVRSYCKESGHGLGLDVLNLKSDDVGLGSLHSRPPFGDPLSKDDIFDSALCLLSDGKCQEFRERGFFDGLIDEAAVLAKAERLDERGEVFEAKLRSPSFDQKMLEPQKSFGSKPKLDVGDEVKVVGKPSVEPTFDVRPSQQAKPKHKGIEAGSGQPLKHSKSRGSRIPPDKLSVDDLVRYINGDDEKKRSPKKGKSTSLTLPPANSHVKKQKRQEVRKHFAVEQMLFQTGENDPDKIAESGDSSRCLHGEDSVTHAGNTGDKDDCYPIDWVERESDETFTTVVHRKRLKAPKDTSLGCDFLAPGSLPRCRTIGHTSDANTSISSAYVLHSAESIISKSGSFSSLDESPPSISIPNEGQVTCSNNVVSTGCYFTKALVKNLPKYLVNSTQETSNQVEPTGGHSGVEVSIISSEPENNTLLSPPQLQADTGFSCSCSMSHEEVFSTQATEVSICGNREINKCCCLEVLVSSSDVSEDIRGIVDNVLTQENPSSGTDSSKFPPAGVLQTSTSVDQATVYNCSSVLCRQPPVIFDTRTIRLDSSTPSADIVFGYDPVDDGGNVNLAHRLSDYCYVVCDTDGITFSGFPDCMPSDSSIYRPIALLSEVPREENLNDNSFAKQPLGTLLVEKNISKASRMEGISPVENNCAESCHGRFQVVSCHGTGETLLQNLDVVNLSTITCVEELRQQSVSPVCFDLFAAQKFLYKAFKDVLRCESEHPGWVVRI